MEHVHDRGTAAGRQDEVSQEQPQLTLPAPTHLSITEQQVLFSPQFSVGDHGAL